MAKAIMDWCKGFTRTTREWPKVWDDALARAELKPHLDLIRAWSDPEVAPENLGIILGMNDLGATPASSSDRRRLPRAVISLLRALRRPDEP